VSKSDERIEVSKSHTIIGETLRVSTFFAQFLADRHEFADLGAEVANERIEWASDVLAEWNARAERRGRPPAAVTEARAILGVQSDADKARAGDEVPVEYVTAARQLEESLIALMIKASRIEKIGESAARQRDEDRAAKADAVLAAMADEAEFGLEVLRDVVGSKLWQAWLTNDGKAHLDGLTAAKRANRATHWTSSRKGHATTIRYDDSAEFRPTVKRQAVQIGATIDEDAILAAIEDQAVAA
jgi:hypothetical protein